MNGLRVNGPRGGMARQISALHSIRSGLLLGGALLGCLLAAGLPAMGQDRPSAPKLLPEETLLYARLRDSQDFVKKFGETALGRMARDEQVEPLISALYGTAGEAFQQVEEELGITLNELLSIPQGEVCFALVAEETGPPVLVLLLEAADHMPKVRTLVERGEELLERQAAAIRSTEKIRGVETTILTFDENGRERKLLWFERDGLMVVTSGLATAERLLATWDGEKPSEGKSLATLAENEAFINIMRRCQGSANERPELTFFVDPIELVRVGTRQNIASAGFMALVPALGLDGLEGFGGSMILGAEEFDTIVHAHLLLDNPRTGVIEVLALGAGDGEPEPWVPADVANYTTLHVEPGRMYADIGRLYDTFRGEGALQAEIERRVSTPLGVNFEEEILPQLAGRLSYTTWMEPPARLNSQATLAGIQLKDPEAFRGVLERVLEQFGDRVEKKSFADVTYYTAREEAGENPPADGPGDGRPRFRPRPSLAVVGNYLLLADRPAFLEKAISTQRGGPSLADDLEFKLIAGKIRKQAGGATPALLSFDRPEEGMRWLYDLVNGEAARDRLARGAEQNEFARGVERAINENPLPPFAVLARYLAPGGGMLIDDETGFHYMGFSLRRK